MVTTATEKTDHDELPNLGKQVRALREELGIGLVDLCNRTGLSRSALYKVEKNQMSLTYENLVKLSRGLGVDISRLFELTDKPAGQNGVNEETRRFPGRRVVGHHSDGKSVDTDNYVDTYLCTDLSNKLFDPVVTEVKAKTMQEFGEWSRHSGEEFSFVIKGSVKFCSEVYEPALLKTGDYVYFDSQMGHAYLKYGSGKAVILTVCAKPPS